MLLAARPSCVTLLLKGDGYMGLSLTDEQLKSVKNGEPLRLTVDNTDYVLIRAELYEGAKSLFDDNPLTQDDRMQLLQDFGTRAGWEDPEMDVYEVYR
jgi:hypothetical protein